MQPKSYEIKKPQFLAKLGLTFFNNLGNTFGFFFLDEIDP